MQQYGSSERNKCCCSFTCPHYFYKEKEIICSSWLRNCSSHFCFSLEREISAVTLRISWRISMLVSSMLMPAALRAARILSLCSWCRLSIEKLSLRCSLLAQNTLLIIGLEKTI